MTDEPQPRPRGCSLPVIAAAIVIAVLALVIAVQVIGVLYGIVSPPLPPLPASARELSHESSDYGVDRWTYSTASDVCGVLLFYETNGGTCEVARGQCGRDGTDQLEPGVSAQCVGETPFSIFHMRWSAALYAEGEQETEIDLSREIFWIGRGPTMTP